MAVVSMRHLRLLTLASRRDALLRDLLKLGIVEISRDNDGSDSNELDALTRLCDTEESEIRTALIEIKSALDALAKYADFKRGMFAPRIRVKESAFFDSRELSGAVREAEEINKIVRELSALHTEEGRLINKRDGLLPWEPLNVLLETESSGSHVAIFGVCPADFRLEDIRSSLERTGSAQVYTSSSDNEQHYLFILAHKDDEEELLNSLREFAFSKVQLKDMKGTAKENIKRLNSEIKRIHEKRGALTKILSEKGGLSERLMTANDALEVKLVGESALSTARATERTVLFEGWFPKREEARLLKLLEKYECAFEVRDPAEGENPPVLTYNSKLVSPFGAISDMYSTPLYGEVDPNPFVAVFFSIFFGIMLSDMAYGLILILFGAFALIKLKPRGTFKKFMMLSVICGISTTVWGALFGGFFGNAIPQIYTMATGAEFNMDFALWFNPLNDPIKMLLFSLILGGIQIVVGMAITAYVLIKDGYFLDAVLDIGLWWLLFAGVVVIIVRDAQAGLMLVGAGAGGIVLTHGRKKKGFFSKLVGGLGSLYGITSYLGDVLSYSRLLALSLATAVIAQVINTMGSLAGVIGFILIFIIGHTFNILVNLIGTFVHSARLQYVEFFGKFFRGGGSSFEPLKLKTKYVDILKEDN